MTITARAGRGSCSDELSGAGGLLTLPETREAIATSDIGHVDVLTWHACLMSMAEVAYELRTVCDYMTSCQFTMPMENILAADLWLGWLKDNQSAATDAYAHKVVESVITRAQFKQKTTHYAMIKMSEMQNLGAAIGNFGNILVQEGGANWGEVLNAWNSTHSTNLDNPKYVDIREFTNQIQAQPNLANSNLINQNAVAVRNALNAAVPFTDTYFQTPDQPVPRGGLNVYMPWQLDQFLPDSVSYSSLQWRATNWHAFISTFVRNNGGGQDPVGACCYNNNTECAEGATQAACQALAGVWHQGQTCAQAGCVGGGGECVVPCTNPHPIALNTPFGCAIPAEGQVTWLSLHLTFPAVYRFQLSSAPGNDFDFRSFATDCNTDVNCFGEAVGDEDVTCGGEDPGSIDLRIGILAFTGSGNFTFLVTQVSVTDEDTHEIAVK
ncbi:MAG: hypothetical protein IPP40_11785 [bacterium]|nr:hypothetical protein [bacterium]